MTTIRFDDYEEYCETMRQDAKKPVNIEQKEFEELNYQLKRVVQKIPKGGEEREVILKALLFINTVLYELHTKDKVDERKQRNARN